MKKALLLAACLLAASLAGCGKEQSELYDRGMDAMEQQDYVTAIGMFQEPSRQRNVWRKATGRSVLPIWKAQNTRALRKRFRTAGTRWSTRTKNSRKM